MTQIDINFNDVPEEFAVVGPGVYLCEIEEAPTIEDKPGKGQMVKAVLTITDEGDFKGQKLFTNQCLWVEPGKRALKRMALSAGVTADESGLDLQDFLGKIVRVQVNTRMYEGKEQANVKDFVLEENVKDEGAQGDL
jgi:hypothetical protein